MVVASAAPLGRPQEPGGQALPPVCTSDRPRRCHVLARRLLWHGVNLLRSGDLWHGSGSSCILRKEARCPCNATDLRWSSLKACPAHHSMTRASLSARFTAMSASQRLYSKAASSSWVVISSGGCSSASRCLLCGSWLECMPWSAQSVRCSPPSACAEVCSPLAVCRSKAS